jgi:fibronectin type III domain protein
MATVSGTVYGKVGGCTNCPLLPLAGDTVNAVAATCPITASDAGACTPVASATTDSGGLYSLSVTSGNAYYVYSTPISGYGGDTVDAAVPSSGLSGVNLYSYPQLPYSNQTFVLPGYAPLSSYLYNTNGNTQVPVLSFSADGVYYVNASSDLVFYSLANGTVQRIASWTQLYSPKAYAGEEENAFFLTLDGSYAYEMGCASACAAGSSLVVHAVNITTGTTFVWTLAGVTYGATASNVQVSMVGFRGNDSLITILTSATSDPIFAYNLWNSTQWEVGNLSYFEANNCYWVPALDSFIDIQADGATADGIQQFELETTNHGWVHLAKVFADTSYPGGGIQSNWVNGLTLNLTLGQISFNYGNTAGATIVSAVYAFNAAGHLSHRVRAVETRLLQGLSYADEHRLEVSTGAPTPEGFYSPYFYNQSWVVNPFTPSTTYYDTNVSVGTRISCTTIPECGLPSIGLSSAPGPSPAHFFLNGSYGIGGYSVDCSGSCPLLGTTPGSSLGTVYWLWNSHRSEFPYPSTSGRVQSTPDPLAVTNYTSGPNLTIQWAPPAEFPVVNYTLFWGTSPGSWTQVLNLSSVTTSETITGLSVGATVYFGVEVWNLHFHSSLATGSAVISGALPAPTGLRVNAFTSSSVSLAWTNPAGTIVNDTVYYGPVCGGYAAALSTGGASTMETVSGLTEGTTYCFAVAAWTASGSSPLSTPVTATPGTLPPAPTGISAGNITTRSLTLTWTNSVGPLTNDTVFESPAAVNVPCSSTGGYQSSYNITPVSHVSVVGLVSGASYCFAIAAWNITGRSPLDALPVSVRTAHVPPAPTDLVVTGVSQSTVSLQWTNPAGAVTNDTVYWGTTCGLLTRSRTTAGPATTWTLAGLSPGTEYCFAVSAWNATGMSALTGSPTTTGRTLTAPPNFPGWSQVEGVAFLAGIGAALAAAVIWIRLRRKGRSPPPAP